ncbi:hypothetical protein OH686_13365 [Pseudomonas sp. SO81]|nr:hypothetical protein OH686_13365 [Pseudomonas sp. SO81]
MGVAEFSLWAALSSVRHLGLVERRGHAPGTFDSISIGTPILTEQAAYSQVTNPR